MNLTSNIGKAIRTMGIMLALAGFMAGTIASSASAASLGPRLEQGKLDIYAIVDTSSNALPAIYVQVADAKGNIVVKGSAAGDGSFGAKLAPGAYTVNITTKGYKLYSETTKVAANSATTIKAVLELEKVAMMGSRGPVVDEGKLNVYAIIDAPGSSIIPVYVQVTDENGNIVAKGIAFADGSFGVKLAPGAYKVVVTSDGYKPYSEIVNVVANDTITVKAALELEK